MVYSAVFAYSPFHQRCPCRHRPPCRHCGTDRETKCGRCVDVVPIAPPTTPYGEQMSARNRNRVRNFVLVSLRRNRGLSQQDLANDLNALSASSHGERLSLDRRAVSRWESGESANPKPYYRLLLAEYFGVTIDELGFARPQSTIDVGAAADDDLGFAETSGQGTDMSSRDQRHWLETRTALNATRRALSLAAAELYPGYHLDGLDNAGVIAHPDWIPATPIPLRTVRLVHDQDATEPAVTGGEPETDHVRPLTDTQQRYRRYHDAIRDLAQPRLFENRLCFRLTGIDLTASTISLQCGQMGFFDSMDVNEALAHETAEYHLAKAHDGSYIATKASWRQLRFRKYIGGPFDLTRRPMMGAIGTLTIRGGESPSVVLHQRDGDRVAGGGGMTHLVPAGIFQPSSVRPSAAGADFSLWRNIQREYAEELLGHDEYDGTGRPISYGTLEPFVTLDRALADGSITIWCLGLTLDALTLSGDLLTVAVIEPTLYDSLFASAVTMNSEGTVSTRALPFEAHTLRHLHDSGTLSPGAAAALHLTWKHRDALLASRV